MKIARCFFLATLLIGLGCSGNTTDDGPVDRDGGPRDSGIPLDAGVRTECTIPENMPVCLAPTDCSRPRQPQMDCATCPDDTESICLAGECETPAVIPPTNGHRYRVSITGFETEVLALVGLVVSAEMVGGAAITCDDAMSRFSWSDWSSNSCFNILRSKYTKITPPVAQVYTLSFASFASGQRSLFLAYGFADELAAQPPIGVTCAEFDVGAPGDGFVDIMGDNLQRIQ
jgi:hypothetical protein